MEAEVLEMSAEAKDLPEAVSESGTVGIVGGPAPRTPPPPSSALPSFLCLPGRDPQWPAASGRERGRGGWEGAFLQGMELSQAPE